MEKKRIIWCDYAAAFQAALECVNTKQSQDFAIKFVPKALPYLTGEGDPPPPAAFNQPAQAGSAWDDWCGEYRRKGNHPAGKSGLRVCASHDLRCMSDVSVFGRRRRPRACCSAHCKLSGWCPCEQKIKQSTFRQRCVVQSSSCCTHWTRTGQCSALTCASPLLCDATHIFRASPLLCDALLCDARGKYGVTCVLLGWADAARSSSMR